MEARTVVVGNGKSSMEIQIAEYPNGPKGNYGSRWSFLTTSQGPHVRVRKYNSETETYAEMVEWLEKYVATKTKAGWTVDSDKTRDWTLDK